MACTTCPDEPADLIRLDPHYFIEGLISAWKVSIYSLECLDKVQNVVLTPRLSGTLVLTQSAAV